MSKANIAQLPAKLYTLLEKLSPQERARVVAATMALFGEPVQAKGGGREVDDSGSGRTPQAAKVFFDQKAPTTKIEELAVAARYRELNGGGTAHSKEQIREVIAAAKRDFDDHNFKRDIYDARRRGLFVKTGEQDKYTLSYNGEKYVDLLPDRAAAKKLGRPRARKRGTRKKPKKGAKGA